ncbi:DUF2225 domain-containing protein [Peribacillus sp. SCS-37]|uniref:DUF2225 domain-containing protein n=1 Tax=Paraperibacillus esterisolvens TaxID=3115296 RepID=UPI003905C4CB
METLSPYFPRNLTCPLCGKTFQSLKTRSKFIGVLRFETDFQPIYSNPEVNPLLYNIAVCTHCGYSFSDDFSPYFPPGTKQVLLDKVADQWVPQDLGGMRTISEGVKAYKLAAYCGGLKQEKHVTMAGIYLRTAWLFRGTNEGQENRFMKLAAHEYESSYMADDFKGTKMSEIRIYYLIADLSRRTGELSKAARYYSKVIERQRQTAETGIIELAKEGWASIRELKSV